MHIIFLLFTPLLLGASTHNPFSGIHIDTQANGFVLSAEDANLREVIESVCWAIKQPCQTDNLLDKVNLSSTFFTTDKWVSWLAKTYGIVHDKNKQAFKLPKAIRKKTSHIVYKPTFQKPSELKKKILKSLPAHKLTLKDADSLNQLYCSGTPEALEEIKKMAEKLDCQPAHILAKIEIIAVASQALKELGIDVFGTWIKLNHNPAIGLDLLKKMSLLETQGQASYLAKPTSILLPNQKMTIKNLEKNKGVAQPATLDLSMQFDFQGKAGIAAAFELKHIYLSNNQFTEHHFKNNAVLVNNELSLLGGIRESITLYENQCFPWIGKIPIIGSLLCRTSTHNKDQVVLLFMQPQRLQRCVKSANS